MASVGQYREDNYRGWNCPVADSHRTYKHGPQELHERTQDMITTAMRSDLADVLLKVAEVSRDELTATDLVELDGLVDDLLSVFNRHAFPPEWNDGTVMDAVSNVQASLLEQDALKEGIDYRSVVGKALEAGGIVAGAAR